jgi:NAD(P)-dependent dehydrogenase (short-subunit alcohol dehydrogenase family)
MASAAANKPVVSAAERKILLVGASRGLGLGLAKSFAAHGWAVVATERRASGGGGLAAAAAASGHIRTELVDINDPQAVQRLRTQLSGERFDVIFIVAGVSDKDPTRPVHEVALDEAIHVFVSNAYSPICFAETFFDLLKPHGTLAIMTSRMGSLTLVATAADGSWEVYRASKAALNMLTRCFINDTSMTAALSCSCILAGSKRIWEATMLRSISRPASKDSTPRSSIGTARASKHSSTIRATSCPGNDSRWCRLTKRMGPHIVSQRLARKSDIGGRSFAGRC